MRSLRLAGWSLLLGAFLATLALVACRPADAFQPTATVALATMPLPTIPRQRAPEPAPEPFVAPELPQAAPEASAAPSWPWDGLPGWEDAQRHPEAYQAWLEAQHPGRTVRRHWALITAYTPHARSCAPYDDGLTAVGADAWQRGLAVDRWTMRAFRRQQVGVHVPGYLWQSCSGQAWVPDDCGGALDASRREGTFHIDIRYRNEGWALNHWGRRRGWVFTVH